MGDMAFPSFLTVSSLVVLAATLITGENHMPNFFYTDANGLKQGPISEQRLKELAMSGIIAPNTPLETDSGHKGTAGQLPGLEFNTAARPTSQTESHTFGSSVNNEKGQVNAQHQQKCKKLEAKGHFGFRMKLAIAVVIALTLIGLRFFSKQQHETRLAGAVDLNTELRKNGFLREQNMYTRFQLFAQFGTAELKDDYFKWASSDADVFDKKPIEKKLRAALAEAQAKISGKIFVTESTYSTKDVRVDGNKSSCGIWVMSNFNSQKVNEILFPMPDISGVRVGDSGIELSASGTTDSIQELVRNRNNYRARIWFTNLREDPVARKKQINPDVLILPPHWPVADVLRVEIFKVR